MTSGIWRGRRKEGGSQNEARKAMHRTFSTGEEQRAMGVLDLWLAGREGGTGWGRVYFLFVLFLLVSKATTTSLPPLASSTVHSPPCSRSPSLTTLLAFLPRKHSPSPTHTQHHPPPEAGGRRYRQREKSIACYLGASQVRSGACRSSGLGGHREGLRQRLEGC